MSFLLFQLMYIIETSVFRAADHFMSRQYIILKQLKYLLIYSIRSTFPKYSDAVKIFHVLKQSPFKILVNPYTSVLRRHGRDR